MELHRCLFSKNGHFTDVGKYTYWEAVDLAFHFNVERHESFLDKLKIAESKQDNISAGNRNNCATSSKTRVIKSSNEAAREDRGSHDRDGVPRFFNKYKHSDDRFHWSYNRRGRNFNSSGNRFMLPRIQRF